ncbi:hypothetical protein MBH78_12900 [Oceanimonas sp. NS1]|uniref:Cupin 2 conserved barrel domain-containing protein n=1 Tax=Oceanimonas doudoroffii TaxID=84158 RepID=A0A233RIE1_9GAMM|nr:hypothetical protein [Oceanimonas doudoroffii]MCT7655334.1 hypothetical protein [Oceanimonas sp. NS1]OXY83156.1 hypothetical protein B6S08_06565 [Oceanimonas doudoroffii]
MNKVLSRVIVGAIALAGLVSVAGAQEAAHIASPEQYELIFENDSVMVLRMELEPGEADTIHRHNNETVYFQSGGKIRIDEQGEVFEAEIPDGHVMWHQAWVHQVTNVGDTPVVAIIVEEKH